MQPFTIRGFKHGWHQQEKNNEDRGAVFFKAQIFFGNFQVFIKDAKVLFGSFPQGCFRQIRE